MKFKERDKVKIKKTGKTGSVVANLTYPKETLVAVFIDYEYKHSIFKEEDLEHQNEKQEIKTI